MPTPSTAELIAALAADTAPVSPLQPMRGAAWVAGALAITIAAVLIVLGLRIDEAGAVHLVPLVLTNGLLLILAISAAMTALAMANPYAGARRSAPKWALAMVAVLPVAAVVDILAHGGEGAFWHDGHGLDCLLASLAASVPVIAALALWTRRGAPAYPRLTAATIGTAGGAMGTMAYGLACPIGELSHMFLWHAATPFVTTVVAAAALHRWLRW